MTKMLLGDIVSLELIDLDPSILEGLIDALCALHTKLQGIAKCSSITLC